METIIFTILRFDYIFVSGLSFWLAFNSKNINREVLNKVNKCMFFGYGWACSYWAISKLFVNIPFPSAYEFAFSWFVMFFSSIYACYLIRKK